MMPMPTSQTHHDAPTGCLIARDGRSLPLRATSIEARAAGGVARVVLKQRFENPYDEPLTVRYQVPLPADGAVSGFAFQLGDRRIVGEVDTLKKARARYETALVEGKSAAILEQDRSSLFTQDVGNIPPHGEIVAEIQIDQKLRWLPKGSWEWRFPTVVAPRYSGASGRVVDAAKLAVAVAEGELDVRAELALTVADTTEGRPESPSHAIHCDERQGALHISLRSASTRLDRDVVVRWPVASSEERAQLTVARPQPSHPRASSAFGLLTLVPPTAPRAEVARDLVLLIDTSGSMHGEPLAQARRVCLALVESLHEDDQLEMIEFSWRPTHWKTASVKATADNKKSARAWLQALAASGGTEMREGILSALAPLRPDAQRQVILISDGLIGFESEIVRTIAERLPRGSRVHTVGVGSSVNRSLTGPAARAGRGVEAVIGIGEDAERAAARLVAHTARPVVVDLALSGTALRGHAPRRVSDLMAGSPATVALELDPAGGTLVVEGSTANGAWRRELAVPATSVHGDGHPFITPLFARECVEDLEIERASGEAARTVDAQIEALGLSFQIATRLTSWVAVSSEATVDPTAPSRHEQMPHELPFGMSVQKLGLRAVAAPFGAPAAAFGGAASAGAPQGMPGFGPPPPAPAAPPPLAPAPASPRQRAQSFEARDRSDVADDEAPEEGADIGALRHLDTLDFLEVGVVDETDADGFMAPEEQLAPMDAPSAPMAEPTPEPAKGRGARVEKKKESLGGRMVASLRRLFGIGLPATLVVLEDDRMVVSVDVPTAFDWKPEAVTIELADGTTVSAEIIVELTTRAGAIEAGQTLRLALRWTGGALASKPHSLTVSSPSGSLTLRV